MDAELESKPEETDENKALREQVRNLYALHNETIFSAWNLLRKELLVLDIENAFTFIPSPDKANLAIETDPFDQSSTLKLNWLDQFGAQVGEIQVRENGSFYAEYDVVHSHPKDVRWFIESITAWGDAESMKSELRLLPAV